MFFISTLKLPLNIYCIKLKRLTGTFDIEHIFIQYVQCMSWIIRLKCPMTKVFPRRRRYSLKQIVPHCNGMPPSVIVVFGLDTRSVVICSSSVVAVMSMFSVVIIVVGNVVDKVDNVEVNLVEVVVCSTNKGNNKITELLQKERTYLTSCWMKTICICYLEVNWLIPKISACRARIWSLVASERGERVTNFIFYRTGWYSAVSIIFTFRWHVYHP